MKYNLTIKVPKMLLAKKKKWVSQNVQTPYIIGICWYCVLDRTVYEWNQVLLHPELTLGGLSSLPMVPTSRNLTAPATSAVGSKPRQFSYLAWRIGLVSSTIYTHGYSYIFLVYGCRDERFADIHVSINPVAKTAKHFPGTYMDPLDMCKPLCLPWYRNSLMPYLY